jgi:hypothetical protein
LINCSSPSFVEKCLIARKDCNHIAVDVDPVFKDAQRRIPSTYSSSFVPPSVLDSESNSRHLYTHNDLNSFHSKPCVLSSPIALFNTLCISIDTSTQYAHFHSKNAFIHLVLCLRAPRNLRASICCSGRVSLFFIGRYVLQTSDNVFPLAS